MGSDLWPQFSLQSTSPGAWPACLCFSLYPQLPFALVFVCTWELYFSKQRLSWFLCTDPAVSTILTPLPSALNLLSCSRGDKYLQHMLFEQISQYWQILQIISRCLTPSNAECFQEEKKSGVSMRTEYIVSNWMRSIQLALFSLYRCMETFSTWWRQKIFGYIASRGNQSLKALPEHQNRATKTLHWELGICKGLFPCIISKPLKSSLGHTIKGT